MTSAPAATSSSTAAAARRNSRVSLRTIFCFIGSAPLLASAFSTGRPLSFAPCSSSSSTSARHRSSARHPVLRAVAEFEELKKEDKNGNNNNNNNNSDDTNQNINNSDDSWIPTQGGFFPRILQRPRTPQKQRDVTEVKTLQEYKSVVVDDKSQMVAVFFYAPWCRACKAVHGRYRKLARDNESTVKFVQVPLTPENGFLHEGLGVPSLPFAHLYHPTAGLVEERKVNKQVFKEFQDVLEEYVQGQCQIDWDKGGVFRDSEDRDDHHQQQQQHQVDYEEGTTLM